MHASDTHADTPIEPSDLTPTLEALLAHAKNFGADHADSIATHGRSLSVSVRGGELEDIDNSENRDIGLRVMVGRRQACVSSSDTSPDSLQKLAERAVAMAKLAPEDPYCGLADIKRISRETPELDLFDPHIVAPDSLKARALEVESAVLGVKGVTQAEGCNASWATSGLYFMTSHGFAAGWRASHHGLGGMALSAKDGHLERDYEFQGTRWLTDIDDAQTIGRLAGTRSVARLGAQQLPSGALPVIFDRRVAGSLISALLGAITGPAIARGISFLKDDLNTALFQPSIQIKDDPLQIRGHGSRPWDGEGVRGTPLNLIEDGVLKSWLLNSASARQLQLQTTGHAARGTSAPPGVSSSNSYMEAGEMSPDALMAETGSGVLVTEMFGPSLNNNTGDYSVGIAGFKIEGGVCTYPVSEITVAGNLKEAFKTLTPANDLVFDASIVAPTLRIEGMTIAGT